MQEQETLPGSQPIRRDSDSFTKEPGEMDNTSGILGKDRELYIKAERTVYKNRIQCKDRDGLGTSLTRSQYPVTIQVQLDLLSHTASG